MSEFSLKCKEYLKLTGETVYQLSASSGLDRTSLQRMITGKRLPGIAFVRQFCDSLRINPFQKRELIELYKIEKNGKEVYYNRKYIQELIRLISPENAFSPDNFHSILSGNFYSGDFSYEVEQQVIRFFKHAMDKDGQGSISTNIPAGNVLLPYVMAHIFSEYSAIPAIHHVFPLLANPEVSQNYNLNLETFLCTLLPVLSGIQDYHPYYYYCQTAPEVFYFQLFPYYLISDDQVLLVCADLKNTLCLEDSLTVAAYRREFDRILKNSHCFFRQSDTPEDVLHIFSDISSRKITVNYALESHPCISFMSYGAGFFQELFANRDHKLDDPVFTQLMAALRQPAYAMSSGNDFCCYFTREGILKFAEQGLLCGPYSYHQTPLPKEERRKVLSHLLDTRLGEGKCRMLKTSVLASTSLHLEVMSDYSVFLCFLSENDTFLCVYLRETSIGQALNDYLCSLSEEESTHTDEETTALITALLNHL